MELSARTFCVIGSAILFAGPLCRAESPLGLSEVQAPEDNPLTKAKIELGKRMFFDKNMSSDGRISCASCHDPGEAFAKRGEAISPGVGGKLGRRNSPSLLNVAFAESLFMDGRAESLEAQAWEPLLADDEMGNKSEQEVLDRLSASADYVRLFKEAFGKAPDKEGVAKALASYQRTLLSGNSAFDRWNWGGEDDALKGKAYEGYELFAGRAQCWQCHPLNGNGILLTDHDFHDTGVAKRSAEEIEKRTKTKKAGEMLLAKDRGRFEVSKRALDKWKYKTPSLRNVELTAPYMHDGSLKTLNDVLQFYNEGGRESSVQILNLTDEEIEAIIAFLESLTGDHKY